MKAKQSLFTLKKGKKKIKKTEKLTFGKPLVCYRIKRHTDRKQKRQIQKKMRGKDCFGIKKKIAIVPQPPYIIQQQTHKAHTRVKFMHVASLSCVNKLDLAHIKLTSLTHFKVCTMIKTRNRHGLLVWFTQHRDYALECKDSKLTYFNWLRPTASACVFL